MTHHPMVPTNEQLKKWEDLWFEENENIDVLLIEAYQAGADAELKACGEVVGYNYDVSADELQSARRPKPLSLADQAMEALELCAKREHYVSHLEYWAPIVLAIKRLQQLEEETK